MPGIFSSNGSRPSISIVNKFSAGGYSVGTINNVLGKEILTGALTADTYATILEVTSGPGFLTILSVVANDTTARTLTIKLTIDGTEIFEATSDSITSADTGIIVLGTYEGAGILSDANGRPWKTSLKIEVKSSLSETDKSTVYVAYDLT